jgi:hypothetical protein
MTLPYAACVIPAGWGGLQRLMMGGESPETHLGVCGGSGAGPLPDNNTSLIAMR